ncbi:MAG: Fic family protein [Actinomycetes bacterium]
MSTQNQLDSLSNLLALPGVAKECEVTLRAIDELMWNRTIRRHQSALTPYTRRIAGFATAALDGAQMPKDPTMEPEVSPMGSLSDQGLLVTAEADLQTLAFKTEPLKVLARLHTFASNDGDRGQPRTSDDIDDPLRIGNVPPHQVLQERLAALVDLIINSKAPVILIAAIAHAELATLRPFTQGSYLVARASTRLILAAREVDVDGLVMSEYGAFLLGRPAYVKALSSYQSGTPDGVAAWIQWQGEAIRKGIEMALQLAELADVKK